MLHDGAHLHWTCQGWVSDHGQFDDLVCALVFLTRVLIGASHVVIDSLDLGEHAGALDDKVRWHAARLPILFLLFLCPDHSIQFLDHLDLVIDLSLI